jgi:sugar porter (SP) family MFS transporter
MLYVTEITPTAQRGKLAVMAPLTATAGILISYLVGYALSGTGAWRAMFGVAIIPSLILMVGMLFAPDSPRWLVRRGRIDAARAVLHQIYMADEAERALAEIRTVAGGQSVGILGLFTDRTLVWPLFLACSLAILQQIVGINTVIYYAPTILGNIGFGPSDAILTTGCLQALAILASLAASRIVDRVGRRPLLLIGAVVMAMSLIAIGLIMQTPLSATTGGHIVAVAALGIYKMAFSFSWGPLVWVMMPEVLPLRARGTGMGLSSFCNWASNFGVSFLFPILLSVGALTVFGVFVGGCVLAFLFTLLLLNETAGISLEALETEHVIDHRPSHALAHH